MSAIYLEYGIPAEEAEMRAAIDAAYRKRYARLQDEHGRYNVPAAEVNRLTTEYKNAHASFAQQRSVEDQKAERLAKKEAARVAAGGAPAPQPTPSSVSADTSAPRTSGARTSGAPQRPAGGAPQPQRPTSAPAAPQPQRPAGGTSATAPRATLVPAPSGAPAAGSADEVAAALAAFTGRPDNKKEF